MSLVKRSEVSKDNQWNLSKLFANEQAWEKALELFNRHIEAIGQYKNKLSLSAETLKAALDADNEASIELERLSYYAMLRLQEDLTNSAMAANYAKVNNAHARYAHASSFMSPEIQAISNDTMQGFLQENLLDDYKISLKKLLRYKPHTLDAEGEALLAPLSEVFNTPDDAFSALTDADMQFGTITTENEGEKPLSQASYSLFIKDEDRAVREKAYRQYYGVYENHKNSIAALYAGSIKQDIYMSRVRGFSSARAKALFADDMPSAVYDNLVKNIRKSFPVLHRYYSLRKKMLNVDELRHYDVYAPLFKSEQKTSYSYEEAVDLICNALSPLGEDYTSVMKAGLLNGWVDRYENIGKSSGAFSAGSYMGDPYILINYKKDDIRSLFTLAHEAGHSMHSYYSVKNNHFSHYNYSIFEAEVASTFNEALLFDYLIKSTDDEKLRRQLLSSRLDDMLATLFRQTMFAEFEQLIHEKVEAGEAAGLDLFRETYQQLLADYFGPEMLFEEISSLEALRIPHFYRAFYVYKYATGISASLALSQRVLKGGAKERDDYLSFLKSGGSYYPLESLRIGGVDMASAEPIESAISVFESILSQLEQTI